MPVAARSRPPVFPAAWTAAAVPISHPAPSPPMTMLTSLKLLALLTMLVAAVFTDLRERRIPNGLTVVGAIVAIMLSTAQGPAILLSSLVGMTVALGLSLPFFALGAIGAGDAKLLSAVGAFMGIGGLLPVALYSAVAGGLIGVAVAVRRGVIVTVLLRVQNAVLHAASLGRRGSPATIQDPDAHTIPYGVAIAMGTLVAWFFPISLGGLS